MVKIRQSAFWKRFQRRNPSPGVTVPTSRRATIADVAAASGVGVGPLSRVINGATGVREPTRARVLRAIEQLGYRPSHLAAALSQGTPRTVAIVIPHPTRASSVGRLGRGPGG